MPRARGRKGHRGRATWGTSLRAMAITAMGGPSVARARTMQRAAAGGGPVNQLTVRDLMTSGVVSVGRCTPLADVIEVMREGQFRHVPVVDDEDEVIGIV